MLRLIACAGVLSCLGAVMAQESAAEPGPAKWIWSKAGVPGPRNQFTCFRKMFDAPVPFKNEEGAGLLRLAADSNAQVWINGQIVRRKVARYHEPLIRAEVIDVRGYLKPRDNVIVVLHHTWGDIITFQRTGNVRPGLWVDAPWLKSDASWKWLKAPGYVEHGKQIVGLIKDPRIRYAQILDGAALLGDSVHEAEFDDSTWAPAAIIEDGPWPAKPADVETPGQREYPVDPAGVVAAGTVQTSQPAAAGDPLKADPLSMAGLIRTATCTPEPQATAAGQAFISGTPLTITGKAGETKYVTFDFHRPVHGYAFAKIADATAGVVMDLGYCELAYAQYTGDMHVRTDGWINPEGVVGAGYADRYVTRAGTQAFEVPDERTVRWLAVHVRFPTDGQVTIKRMGMIHSQYPIRRIGTFACGDERLEQIMRLCLVHAEVTMSDTYVDTPGREDGQWIEDARPRAQLAERWFGDTTLRAFMIRTLAESQGSDGNLHPFAPSNYPAYPAPYDWSVQWVAMLHDQYLWTGEIEQIRPYWGHLRRYWEGALKHLGEDGIWRTPHVLADLRVGHHPGPGGSSGMVTPWIIQRLRWSAELAKALGEAEQGDRWATDAERMAVAFRKHHIVPKAGDVPAHVADRWQPDKPNEPRGYSQAGQTVAVMAGLLDPQLARADLEHAFPAPVGSPPDGVTRWNNPTYGYRVLRAMSLVDMSGRAVAHLKERYEPYLPAHPRNCVPLTLQGPLGGPLPEYWVSREDLGLKAGQKNTAQPADETGSHGWGSVPLLWMHDSLLGVEVTEPGGGHIEIHPDTGGLAYVAGWTMTPKGPVWVNWDPQQQRIEVELPVGVEAGLGAGRPIDMIESAAEPQQGKGRWILSGPGRYVGRTESSGTRP